MVRATAPLVGDCVTRLAKRRGGRLLVQYGQQCVIKARPSAFCGWTGEYVKRMCENDKRKCPLLDFEATWHSKGGRDWGR